MSESGEYRLRWRGRETGPWPLAEINRQLDEHEIGTGHEIFYENDWITLEDFFRATQKPVAPPPVPERSIAAVSSATHALHLKPTPVRVKVAAPQQPEVAKARAPKPVEGPRPRYRLVFAFLAVIAGFLGAHNFYARQWLTGLLQLLLSVATFLMGFGIVASWLWAALEAVFVRKDGDGIDMI